MSGHPKVTFKPIFILYGLIFIALITIASHFTLEKALAKSKELSQYQIDKTRKYLGEEKAREMKDYVEGRSSGDGSREEEDEVDQVDEEQVADTAAE